RQMKAARLSLTSLALLLIGCSHRVQLRAVDNARGEAVPGARVQVEERGHSAYLYRSRHIRLVGVTDTKGMIALDGFSPRHLIYVEAAGYYPALLALNQSNVLSISWCFSPDSPLAESPPMGPWTSSGAAGQKPNLTNTVPLKARASP